MQRCVENLHTMSLTTNNTLTEVFDQSVVKLILNSIFIVQQLSGVGLGSCRPSNPLSTPCSIVAGVAPLQPFIYTNLIFWGECSSQNRSYFSKIISRAYIYTDQKHTSGAGLAKIRLAVWKIWTLELKIAKHCVLLITIYNHM